jgi:cobalt/nickel transport system permease protein
MKHGLDRYADLDSPLHRWDPRYKLAGFFALIFAYAYVQDLRLLPAMVVLTVAIYVASRLPLSFLLTRLRYPGIFLSVVAVLLPFFSGQTVLFHLGPLTLRQEGLLALLLIVVKFVSILTVSLVLFGTAPFLTTIKAMRALGLPPILADMTLFSYRYIFEVGDDLQSMQQAMRLRGFRTHRPDRRTVGALASLAGSLLVRSYEQSERVYKAMVLRGYGHAPRVPDEFQTRPSDRILLIGVLLLTAGFVTAEILLRQLGG